MIESSKNSKQKHLLPPEVFACIFRQGMKKGRAFFMESKKSLGFASSMLGKKTNNIFPNGDLMVIHHGTIRKKCHHETNPRS